MPIKFQPWRGSDYEATRLLVIGDSFHSAEPGDEDNEQLTTELVQRYFEGERFTTYDNLGKALSGNDLVWVEANKQRLWASFAFYNYFQEHMADANGRPTARQTANAKAAFPELLALLRPTHAIALGDRVWKNLPKETETLPKLPGNWSDGQTGVCAYLIDGHRTEVVSLGHPARAFADAVWHQTLGLFLKDVDLWFIGNR